MAVWDKDGNYNERRALMLLQYVQGVAPLSAVEPLDEDDLRNIKSMRDSYKKAKEMGIENPIFDVVYD